MKLDRQEKNVETHDKKLVNLTYMQSSSFTMNLSSEYP